MSHLIRSVSGTNRDPIYGLWHVCEICPEDPEIPGEAEMLQRIIDSVDQRPGMSLAEFWSTYTGNLLEKSIRGGAAETF
jgi:hypothetical protein